MNSYLITDPKYYSNKAQVFEKKLEETFKKQKVQMACFRDKESSNFEELAKIFIEVCKKNEIEKTFINSNFKLAKELNASGVHLTSTQFNQITKAQNLNLEIIISCHNEEEIQKAIKHNIKTITYSPIFETPNKGEPKGIENLRDIIIKYKELNIIALGGIIKKEHIKNLEQTKAYAFASIRYFI